LVLKINGTQDIAKLGGMYKSYPLDFPLTGHPVIFFGGYSPTLRILAKNISDTRRTCQRNTFLIAFIVLGKFSYLMGSGQNMG
jgi:multicomponent Na+:H+ antiporter subunit D